MVNFLRNRRRLGTAKGFSLIEMIVCIVVAAIFIPMAYIAFMAVMRDSMNPEAIVTARFLAERKIEEITKDTYTTLREEASYGTFSEYPGYQWRWTITNIAYQGRATHGTPTIAIPEPWAGSTPTTPMIYRVGDYVTPVSGTAPYYRCSTRPLEMFPQWTATTAYSVGDFVVPPTPNGHSYRCVGAGTSAALEDPGSYWPATGSFLDNTVTWQENTNTHTAGMATPTWGIPPVYDGSILWRESTVYKQITVSVRNPQGYEYAVSTIVSARPGVYP